MINPLPISVNFSQMELFQNIPNISHNAHADITIDNPMPNKYNIYCFKTPDSLTREVWVTSQSRKIEMERTGVTVPVFVLTEDKTLLPYCMKDRLATLQDRINKKQISL